MRGAVHDVNPRLAIFNIKSMDQVVADSFWELNLYRWLIGLFAGLAVLLGAIGLYGVISYNVTSRMREFALRLALDPIRAPWLDACWHVVRCSPASGLELGWERRSRSCRCFESCRRVFRARP